MPDENVQQNHQLAILQGQAYEQALSFHKNHFLNQTKDIEDYTITLLFSGAEGMYIVDPEGNLGWQIPYPGENQYIKAVIQDRDDKRFIPDLKVTLRIYDIHTELIGDMILPFVWHPVLYHYGANWILPGEGDYTLQISIEEPVFPRLTQQGENKYNTTITKQFELLHLVPVYN